MFNYDWILRHLKLSEIVMLLFLMMTTFSVMPGYVWGDEIYAYTDKNGTMVISNTQPQEDINLTTDLDENLRQDATPPPENISYNTRRINSYQDSTSDERLHWGRDSALIDVQKRRYGKSQTVKDSSSMDSGRYDVNIKKIASNLYQDISTRMIIKTLACVELAGTDGSSLHWSGTSGELFFQNTNKTCMVRKVYK
jgi:hypothetical protein